MCIWKNVFWGNEFPWKIVKPLTKINLLGVEIIDLSDDDDDDEGEVEGVTCFANSGPKRVIEALQTCPWNDLKGILIILSLRRTISSWPIIKLRVRFLFKMPFLNFFDQKWNF